MNKFKETDIREPILFAQKHFLELGIAPRVAEIGVYNGDHAEVMLEYLKPKKLLLIDPWDNFFRNDNMEERYATVVKKFSNNPDVKIIRRTSFDAASRKFLYKGESRFLYDGLNMGYIDADHLYSSVLLDLVLWTPLIIKGGIVAGHDWNRPGREVERAVTEYCIKCGYKIQLDDKKRNWWFIK